MKTKGFTLIELLVVVAVIGILATIVLGSLSNARTRAEEARFIAEVSNFRSAMELYYLDNGTYPTNSFVGYSDPSLYQDFIDDLAPYFDVTALSYENTPDTVTHLTYIPPTSPVNGSCPNRNIGQYGLRVNMVNSTNSYVARSFPGDNIGYSGSSYGNPVMQYCVTP
jgi:prepilin-type N-terminal cleavage/methylation domain-containing protein